MKLSKVAPLVCLLLGVFCSYASSIPILNILDPDLISAILDYPGNFTDKQEEMLCEQMVNNLTLEQQETAARTSHAYWLASLTKNKHLPLETRKRAAKKEARRHLAAEKGNLDRAMTRLREACHFRKEKKFDLLRLCFVENSIDLITNEDERQLLHRWESQIQKEMSRQATWVSSDESNQQAIVHRLSRNSAEIDDEAYHLLIFYATERALATNELLSKGQKESGTIVLYFENYHSENMPPLSIVRTSLTDLQMLYPERITQINVLDPPRWLRITYRIVSMFLSKETRNKVHMLSGKAAKVTETKIDSEYWQGRDGIEETDFLFSFRSILSIAAPSDADTESCLLVEEAS